MKKITKQKIAVLLLSSLCFSASAQTPTGCAGTGHPSGNTWNPPVAQVKTPSATLGGFTLPNTTIKNSFKNIIGDFNGDGLDDVLMVYEECQNSDCSLSNGTRLKMFTSNGNGDFTNSWTSGLNDLQVINLYNSSNGTLPLLDMSIIKFVVGDFIGDSKDEVLVYKTPSTISSNDGFYSLLSDLNSSPCIRVFHKQFLPPHSDLTLKIGLASMGATFYAANLIGDQHDELFSLESQGAGLPKKWFVQQIVNSGIVTGTTGTFSFESDGLYFENFDLASSYDELFTINSAWAMLQGYNGSTFVYKWSDMGNGSFFGNNQCWDNSHLYFPANRQLLFGNLDNCDDDIECMIFSNNDLEHPITLEFNSLQNQFKCNSVLWPNLVGSNNVNTSQSQLAVTVYERYVTPTTCANYLWNTNTCLQWTGGQTIMAQRQFYSRSEKDGPLSILMGNFYNNTTQNGFIRKTKELLVFRNNYLQTVPSNLNSLTWFTTNCSPNGLNGGGCNGNTNIAFINPLGQTVALYNKPNDSFNGYGYKNGANYSMYSLTNGTQNLRLGSFAGAESSPKNQDQFVEMTISPNPADEAIEILFSSSESIYDAEIAIINAKGEASLVDKIDILEGVNKLNLNVSHLAPGFYLVRASNKEKVFTKKFVKN